MSRETGLYLFHGNRLESLAEVLAEKIQTRPSAPLEAETILVQSKGMQKWLSLTLARKLGICANCVFPFPNALVQRFFSLLPGEPKESPLFEREVMSFTIFQALPELVRESAFAPLRNYLGDETSSLKAHQLARRLANLFDQYATYRPDHLVAWGQGREGDWQGELWRRIVSPEPCSHRAALQMEFFRQARQGRIEARNFPPRINVFAVSTLPPFHIEMLTAAAEFSAVYFYLLNPCREYWFDLLPAKSGARLQIQEASEEKGYLDSRHYETGHPLLSSWGITGSAFLGALFENGIIQEEALFAPPGEGSLLRRLQDDILSCRRRSPKDKVSVPRGDTSLQVHSCHTPLREMEVLQDFLLCCLDTIPGLKASDILVMCPDIEGYAPYISAVFDAVEDEFRRLPYAIADRNSCDSNRIARFFIELLALRKSRFEASRVMALLESPDIQRRFALQGAGP